MNRFAAAFVGMAIFCTGAQAAETLNAEAVKKLISGNTAHGMGADGALVKNYFAPDGTLLRFTGDKTIEGKWRVNDDGTQCVEGMPGGCARIVRNDDGIYDRVDASSGKTLLKWTKFVPGKDF